MKYTSILILFLALRGFAQTGKEILDRSVEKIKSLKDISYNIYLENTNEKMTGNVVIKRGDSLPFFEVGILKGSGIAINNEGSRQINFAWNGSKFDFIHPRTNELVTIDSPTYSKLGRAGMFDDMSLALGPYWQSKPLEAYRQQGATAEILGDTIIYKIPCYKLKLMADINTRLGMMKIESVWFIGKKDFLIYGHRTSGSADYLNIQSVDKGIGKNEFVLSTAAETKHMTGLEPLTDGILAVGSKAPLWSLPSSLGTPLSLESLRGQVVLLDFWGTWCIPCIRSMPDIQAIHDHFRGKPVTVIGISVEPEKKADPIGFAKKQGYDYLIALNGTTITKDYKVAEFPTVYVIDKTGNIIHAEHSAGRENFKEDLIQKIENELKKN